MKIKTIDTIVGLLLVFVTVFLGGIEFSTYKINEFNNKVYDTQLAHMNYFMEALQNQNAFLDARLLNGLHVPIYVINFEGIKYLDEEEKILAEKFKQGTITMEYYQFLKQELFADKYLKSVNNINDSRQKLRDLYRDGTPWTLYRSIFLILEAISILFTVFFYVVLIKKRT